MSLINKQYKNYDRVSRYSTFPYYYNTDDDKFIYGITAYLKNKNTPYMNHKVQLRDTLDTLSLYYYGNPTYYWVIADFNRIQDPYKPLKVGEIIKIPTFSTIQFDI